MLVYIELSRLKTVGSPTVFSLCKKSHLLNCKCDTFVNITSPTQLQDGTTYDFSNIIHHICMKSNKKLFRVV